MLKYKLLY